jgi:hypothetical protein
MRIAVAILRELAQFRFRALESKRCAMELRHLVEKFPLARGG